MALIYINDDLLKSDCDVIVHGCNCFHTFGSGIAKQIKEQYNGAYLKDINDSKFANKEKLGSYTKYITQNKHYDKNITIINAYTQYNYGNKNIMYADYDAIKKVMIRIKDNVSPLSKIGMPKIGCGLANGDWKIVSKIIEDVFTDRDIYIYSI